MPNKYQNKYRISSARLQTWNYGSAASYFVTICTKHREHFFGKIANGEMMLNAIGKITEDEWIRSLALRPDMNLELGEFVVMPNHFHGIIIIGENQYNTASCRDAMHCVSTATPNHFGPQSKNLASITGGFKSAVTTQTRKLTATKCIPSLPVFAWQPRFHEHIIRDAKSFERIQHYIINNPSNWEDDKFYH